MQCQYFRIFFSRADFSFEGIFEIIKKGMPDTSASFLLFPERGCIFFLGGEEKLHFWVLFFRFDADYHLGQIF